MSSPENLTRRKAALRAELLVRRAGLARQFGAPAAEAAAEWLRRAVPLAPGAAISGYWPLDAELDPRPALLRLAAAGHPIALPRMVGSKQPLMFHRWRRDEALIEGRFRVMEPTPAQPELRPEVLLVPLLAFDRAGHRLGYGAGFYDRTLRHLRASAPAPLAVGFAFAGQEVPDLPAGPNDEPLDLVVTERGVHRCSPAPASGHIAGLERA